MKRLLALLILLAVVLWLRRDRDAELAPVEEPAPCVRAGLSCTTHGSLWRSSGVGACDYVRSEWPYGDRGWAA